MARFRTNTQQLSLFDARPEPEPPVVAVTEPEPPAPEPAVSAPRPPTIPATTSGEKAKAHAAVRAIRTLKQVEAEHRAATPEERDALSRFPGFGPLALTIFPDPITGRYKDGWQALGEELRSLLTDEEYESAKRTVYNAFYTAPVVIDAMHEAMARLGVPQDALVLEPGCGVGRMIAQAPTSYRFIGVELDSVSGRIARLLHPHADIRIQNFRDAKLPALDAVLGNVPFANVKLEHAGTRWSLHDYFFAKSIDSLKPGGVLALVTSHYTLDKQNGAIREFLADRADFLGAIRLPSNAFKKEGTEVVTDIVFLRKRGPGQPENHVDYEWKQSAPTEIDGSFVPINRYFVNHPEMVLGTLCGKGGIYGTDGYTVESSGDLAEQLRNAVGQLPRVDRKPAEQLPRFEPERVEAQNTQPPPKGANSPQLESTPFVPPPPLPHVTEGSFFVHDGRVHQLADGLSVPVVYGGSELWANGNLVGRRVGHLIRLRDLARRVLQSQNEGWPEPDRQAARRELNRCYDQFHSAYGPINKTTLSETKDGSTIRRMPNLALFRNDPDAMLVMALECYDEETGTAEKAPILLKDVVGKTPPVTRVGTAEEGLLVSLDRTGGVDLPLIARLYGKPEPAVVAELGDLIYQDPETNRWEAADAYLSGNVRAKLAAAEKAGVERNVEALKAVIPEDVLPGDIDANIGAPWIPVSDVQQFAAELFQVQPGSITIAHMPKDAVWSVAGDWGAERAVAVTSDYGTSRASGLWLLDLALNMKSPVIYDPVPGDPDKRMVNQEATLAAKEKQRAIKEAFKSWVFADPDRTERLVRTYNDNFNNLRPRQFDGSHLAFPGMSEGIKLRPHQADAVWRGMAGGNTLLAHCVGAGKAQPLDAKVLTPTGWVRMGDLRVDDEVIAGDGTVTAVTGVFPQGRKAIWRVAFSDGSSTECCDEHLWLTWNYGERTYGERGKKLGKDWPCGRPRVRSTAEIRATLISPHLGAKNHSIPIVSPVHFAEQAVPLDPYTLGVLLGDGCLTQSRVTLANPDLEILDYLRLPDNVTIRDVTGGGRCPAFAFPMVKIRGSRAARSKNPLSEALRGLGLIGTGSPERFVPDCYKVNSPDVRLGILRGLLDTDGYVEKRGCSTYYYTTSPRLADDVTFLVRSLGGVVSRTMKERPTFRHRGELRVGRPCFVLCLSMPPETNPFRLSRKANGVRPKSSYVPRRYVVGVEPVGEKEARCISVAHPSQLYVTDDFIVTHNTMVQAATAMKLKQCGLAKKTMCVVPNHCLEQFGREFLQLYPNAKLLTATKDDFARDRRKLLTAKIAGGDWDAIVVTHSSFERIGMSRDYQEQFLRDQIAEYDRLLTDRPANDYSKPNRNIIKSIEKQKASREARLKDLLAEEKKDTGLVFDDLGVDHLCIDESHFFKNLETPTKMDRVAGIQTGGSERAFDLLMKCRYLHDKHPGHGVTFATGTPISNSLAELYTLQRFLDPDGLAARGIDHFDAWAATFGEVVESMEISPDGKTLKPRARFSKFVNLPELQQQFRQFADVQTADMLDLPRPKLEGGKAHVVACPMSDEQEAIQGTLVERYERIRNGGVDPRDDNALAITTDGRKLALDARMLSPDAPLAPGSKIDAMLDRTAGTWKQTAATKATQMIFCDMGVNPTPWGYGVYDEIVAGLVQRGIPHEQIAVMGDADSDAKKQALFEKVRQGQIRVLIGSTGKMGTGTNVQRRLVAMHHLDAPWKPAEVEQRDGRILRQGNQNEEVSIYRYVTEGSFDAYMWQALETKAKFIAQIMTGESGVRRAEDVGGQELSYAEVKAIASGNPAVLTLAEADAELQRLGVLKRNHADEQYLARRNLRELPEKIDRTERRLAALEADAATIAGGEPGVLVMNGRSVAPQEPALGNALLRLPDYVDHRRQFGLGQYRGLDFGVAKHAGGAVDVYLEGAGFRTAQLFKDSHGPKAVWNALNRIAGSYGERAAETREDVELARSQLADYEARLGRVFPHAAYLDELTGLRDRLKVSLSGTPAEGEPTAAALAERVKALRESHKVEDAPARVKARPRAETVRRKDEAKPAEKVEEPEPVVESFRDRVRAKSVQRGLF